MPHHAGQRPHVDNRAPAAALHERRTITDAEHRPGQVDRQQPVPFLDRHVAELLAQIDAGIVDKDVEAAMALENFVRHPAPAFRIRDIEPVKRCVVTVPVQFGSQLLSVRFENVGDDDPRAFVGKQPCFLGSHAPRTAGYQCGFSFKPFFHLNVSMCNLKGVEHARRLS